MAKTLPNGTIFRHKRTGELWEVVDHTARFNSGMGGASYYVVRANTRRKKFKDIDNAKNVEAILWVSAEYGHPEWELVNGLERAIGKAAKKLG